VLFLRKIYDILYGVKSPLTRAIPLIKAALSLSPHRSRLLHLLSFVMFPPPSSFVSSIHPYHFLSFLQGLFTLLSVYSPISNEAALVHQMLRRLLSGPSTSGSDSVSGTTAMGRVGGLGTPQVLAQSDMQTVYGVAWEQRDTEGNVRRVMGLDALSRAMDGAAVDMGTVQGPEMEKWCALAEVSVVLSIFSGHSFLFSFPTFAGILAFSKHIDPYSFTHVHTSFCIHAVRRHALASSILSLHTSHTCSCFLLAPIFSSHNFFSGLISGHACLFVKSRRGSHNACIPNTYPSHHRNVQTQRM
jgi:hypothetical protein